MYTLTLTKSERDAIDWVGYRYGHGDELRAILENAMRKINPDYDCDKWEERIDTTFQIPEYLAWDICDIAEECEYRWDCFAPELAEKLTNFCMGVI